MIGRILRAWSDRERDVVELKLVVDRALAETLGASWVVGETRLRRRRDGRFVLMYRSVGDALEAELATDQVNESTPIERDETFELEPDAAVSIENDADHSIVVTVQIRRADS